MRDRTEYFREYNKKYYARNKESEAERHQAWRIGNKENRNTYMRKWHAEKRADDPEGHAKKVRKHVLKRRYGITPECYDAMLTKQNGCCALCDRTESDERYNRLLVDHCHTTGRVRGLLCTVHNSAIAALGDNEEGILLALSYLKGGV